MVMVVVEGKVVLNIKEVAELEVVEVVISVAAVGTIVVEEDHPTYLTF